LRARVVVPLVFGVALFAGAAGAWGPAITRRIRLELAIRHAADDPRALLGFDDPRATVAVIQAHPNDLELVRQAVRLLAATNPDALPEVRPALEELAVKGEPLARLVALYLLDSPPEPLRDEPRLKIKLLDEHRKTTARRFADDVLGYFRQTLDREIVVVPPAQLDLGLLALDSDHAMAALAPLDKLRALRAFAAMTGLAVRERSPLTLEVYDPRGNR
jgi:hypothetical protein